MKVYKVVKKQGIRRVSCWASEKFKLYYPKGAVVEAPKGTMGIFCFKKLKDAKRFAWEDELIIEVDGIGKPYRPCFVCSLQQEHWYNMYKKVSRKYKSPKGTICFPKVKVLT